MALTVSELATLYKIKERQVYQKEREIDIKENELFELRDASPNSYDDVCSYYIPSRKMKMLKAN